MKHRFLSLLFFLFTTSVYCFPQNSDIDIVKEINPQNPSSDYWKLTSSSAYFISAAVPFAVLSAGLIKKDRNLEIATFRILGSLVIEVITTESLKRIVDRKRPAESYPSDIFPYRQLHGKSFPSGHSSLAFTTAANLSIQFKKWYVIIPAYLWACSVAYSRLYLGVHYPSDVIMGAAAGIGSAYLSDWVNRKIFRTKNRRQILS